MTEPSAAEIIAEAKQHLRDQDNGYGPDFSGWAEAVRALIALAEQPRLPDEPTPAIIQAMYYEAGMCGLGAGHGEQPLRRQLEGIYRALRDHLLAPRKGWRVEWEDTVGNDCRSLFKTWNEVEEWMSGSRGVRFTVVPL